MTLKEDIDKIGDTNIKNILMQLHDIAKLELSAITGIFILTIISFLILLIIK